MAKFITITNANSDIVVEFAAPYNRTYTLNKATTDIAWRGGDIVQVIWGSGSTYRDKSIDIDFNNVLTPTVTSGAALMTILANYKQVGTAGGYEDFTVTDATQSVFQTVGTLSNQPIVLRDNSALQGGDFVRTSDNIITLTVVATTGTKIRIYY